MSCIASVAEVEFYCIGEAVCYTYRAAECTAKLRLAYVVSVAI